MKIESKDLGDLEKFTIVFSSLWLLLRFQFCPRRYNEKILSFESDPMKPDYSKIR